jgi:hypothetical protein
MKKLVLLLAVILFGFNSVSKAQQILPNGNFEDWSMYVPVSHPPYYEPAGGFFKTMNILDTIPTPPGLTVYKCDTAHSGTYSARCITRKIDILNILIPGVVGNITMRFETSSAILGVPFKWTTKPVRFQGYYKSYPVGTDSTGVLLLLSKWNTSTKKRDTIAYNKLVFHGTVSDWTGFDAAIEYRNTTVMPDSVCILLLSCAGYNASNMFGSVGRVGSQALFDDITLTGVFPWGVDNLLKQDMSLSISPNPASDYINVKIGKAVNNGILEVYDVKGQIVSLFDMPGISDRFNISKLSVGMYYCRFRDGKQTIASGSFIINR